MVIRLGKFAATAVCCVPADMSVTVPVITTCVDVVAPMAWCIDGCFGWSHAESVNLVIVGV